MKAEVYQFGKILDGVAANAAAATRTAVVNCDSCSIVTFTVHLTQVAATALSAVLYKSVDGGTNYGQVHSVSVSSGTGTASEYTITETVSGNDDLTVDLSVAAATHCKIVVSATGGGATDLISVYAGGAR